MSGHCQDTIRKQGVGGGRKTNGDTSTATIVSDETSRAEQKSRPFLQVAVRNAVPCHRTPNRDTGLLTMTLLSLPLYHCLDPEKPGSASNPERWKAVGYGPKSNCTVHTISSLPRELPDIDFGWPGELQAALEGLFVGELYGTRNDPDPEWHVFGYLRGPDDVPGIGAHFDYGRNGLHKLRMNFELSEISGRLVFHAYAAVRKKDSTEGGDGDKVDSGYALALPQKLITKITIDRAPGSSMYLMGPGENGSGLFVDSGNDEGVLLQHSFEVDKRDGQRALFVVDFHYRNVKSLHKAVEKLKKGPLCIADYLSDEAKVKLDEYHNGLSPNETTESAALEVVNRIRATPVSDAVTRCENHETCGGIAFTYNPEDPKINGEHVLRRCHECSKVGDLARPCSDRCGRESHKATLSYCLECKPGGYTCSGPCGERLTYGGPRDTYLGQMVCKECASVYESDRNKRKRAEATSAAVEAGRKVRASGNLEYLYFDYRQIKLIVWAVCECRSSPASNIRWTEVMKKLWGRDDFPSTATQRDVMRAWDTKTGKPVSVVAYENSPKATANEEKGDLITGVCSGCDNEQSMFCSQLANRQMCRSCSKKNKFTLKDETMDSTEGEGNE